MKHTGSYIALYAPILQFILKVFTYDKEYFLKHRHTNLLNSTVSIP